LDPSPPVFIELDLQDDKTVQLGVPTDPENHYTFLNVKDDYDERNVDNFIVYDKATRRIYLAPTAPEHVGEWEIEVRISDNFYSLPLSTTYTIRVLVKPDDASYFVQTNSDPYFLWQPEDVVYILEEAKYAEKTLRGSSPGASSLSVDSIEIIQLP